MYKLFLIGFVFLVSCDTQKKSPILWIGKRTLSEREIEYRINQQRFEHGQPNLSPETVVTQLVKAYLGAEILEKYNRTVTQEILDNEANRIDKTTLMPHRLKQMKEFFPKHTDYINLFVLPVYVNQVLYFDFFANHRPFHEEPFQKISTFREQIIKIKNRRLLKQKAQNEGYIWNQTKITPMGTFPVDEKMAPTSSSSVVPNRVEKAAFKNQNPQNDSQKLIKEVLEKLKIGETTPVLEFQSHFSFMQLYEKKSQEYKLDVISIDKNNYDRWFLKEAKTIVLNCSKLEFCKNLKLSLGF